VVACFYLRLIVPLCHGIPLYLRAVVFTSEQYHSCASMRRCSVLGPLLNCSLHVTLVLMEDGRSVCVTIVCRQLCFII
jgi:hypothetical protein